MMDHGRTRSRRTDDRFGSGLFEDFDEPPGQGARFLPIAGVKGRLAAAGLPLVEYYFTTRTPQHFDRGSADRRPKLIDQTGDE
jgi:hypothetical protein